MTISQLENPLESLRKTAQTAERRKSEMLDYLARVAILYSRGERARFELGEAAQCYTAVRQACQFAQERYRAAVAREAGVI